MPTYEYLCDTCGYHFEEFQYIKDPPIEFCPKCKEKVKKIMAKAGFIFKSKGFYDTDYKVKTGKEEELKKEESKEKDCS